MAERHVEIWTQVVERCRHIKGVRASSVEIWIAPGIPEGVEDKRLVVAFPSSVLSWTARRYRGLLGELVRDLDAGLDGIRIKRQSPEKAAPEGDKDG